RHRPLHDRVVDAPRHLLQVEERHRAVGLRIEIDEQRPLAAERQRRRQVDGGRRLADAAFLVRDRDDHERAGTRGTETARYCSAGARRGATAPAHRGAGGAAAAYILYLPRSSGSRLSSHLCSRSASVLSAEGSSVLALSMTESSTKIGARVRSA